MKKRELKKGKGKLWLGGMLMGTVTKSKFDNEIEYEEIDDPNGPGKIRVPMGNKVAGSVTFLKKDSDLFMHRLRREQLGFEFDAIVTEENLETGDFETVRYIDCTVDKVPLSDFENKKITQVELSVSARAYKVIV